MARARPLSLSHVDQSGTARMVDVGDKASTRREAIAEGFIAVSAAALRLARTGIARKGSPIEVARIAGIQAAKRTSDLIPLCHPLSLTYVAVDFEPQPKGYRIVAEVRTSGQTGVEMEALTAVSVAALTVYDMLKAADRRMRIEGIRLLEKKGGRTGHYRARAT